MRTGLAHMPLHGGAAPKWLFDRMKLLAREITVAVCGEYGTEGFLKRVTDPFWFQAFGCVLGFDWHSSGVTTTVCGALKEAMRDAGKDVGLFVCGGKGATSRKTPQELEELCLKRYVDRGADPLVYASRMSAKVDNTAVQDGYQLYHHTFFVNDRGKWAVVQQGMNRETGWARRYHWLGDEIKDFVCEPHKAVCSERTGPALNMTAAESSGARRAGSVIASSDPDNTVKEYERILELKMPRRHEVSLHDIRPSNLKKIMTVTYDNGPENFEKLLGIQGVGPGTIRALALIGEIVYGESPSFRDPARFTFAHGGKDGFPYPVDKKRYDTSIDFLSKALSRARLGNSEKMKALKRLYSYAGKK